MVFGEDKFLKKLQRLVDKFVWNGRNRVARATITLSKSEGGLGQIDIAAQYKSLTGSFVIWVTMTGSHPLREILRDHIGQLSQRRWGTRDLSRVVSRCRQLQSKGSSTWRNICQAWHDLKPLITQRRPVNLTEWRALPLWRPHVNHVLEKPVRCFTRAQLQLRDNGLLCMGDILEPAGSIIPWTMAEARGLPRSCQAAFMAMVANLVPTPILDASPTLQEFFVESVGLEGAQMVWGFCSPLGRTLRAGCLSWIELIQRRRIFAKALCCVQFRFVLRALR